MIDGDLGDPFEQAILAEQDDNDGESGGVRFSRRRGEIERRLEAHIELCALCSKGAPCPRGAEIVRMGMAERRR